MARTTTTTNATVTAPACPIRIVAVQLLSAAGRTCRQLFLTADGELSLHPHWLPRWAASPGCGCAEAPLAGAFPPQVTTACVRIPTSPLPTVDPWDFHASATIPP